MCEQGDKMSYWTCKGSVRGTCGHKHKAVRTAFACLQDDAARCRQQGGYSDRKIIGVEDGEEFAAIPYDILGKPLSEREERLCCEIACLERQYSNRGCQ